MKQETGDEESKREGIVVLQSSQSDEKDAICDRHRTTFTQSK
jgi:hypothetical protein